MICFIWDGFPQYAARCVGAFARSTDEPVTVVATRPAVPVSGMEAACGGSVHWVEPGDVRPLREIVGEMPRAAVVSGWFPPVFNRWRDEVRAHGGRVVAMCDNNWTGHSLRMWARSIRFRLLLRGKFDGYFVPGASGVRFMRFCGVRPERIATGVYAADSAVFHDGAPLAARAKRVVFVGQFILRKNVLRLVEAFARTGVRGWSLDLYGAGPLKGELVARADAFNARLADAGSHIGVNDFVQPEELAEIYRTARVFCLPSTEEHWGLVAHEAALSGCVLLLGNSVGAAADLLAAGLNGRTFDPADGEELTRALKWAMAMETSALDSAHAESLRMAQNASIEKFVDGVSKLVGGGA